MRRFTSGWRAALLAIVALVGLAMGQRSVHAASDLVYEGQFDIGGTIRLTLSPDGSGVTSFALNDVPFLVEGCGSYQAFASAYYDPPLPIVGGAFEIAAGYGDPHGDVGYTVRGDIGSGSRLQGVARASAFRAGGACNASSGELAWSAEGPVTATPYENDVQYAGELGGGQIAIFASPDRSELNGVKIQNAVLPCLDDPLDLDVVFAPPLELRQPGNEFLGVVLAYLGEPRVRTFFNIVATSPAQAAIGGFIDSGIFCGSANRHLMWSATLVNQLATAMPAAPGLPVTGGLPGRHGSYPWELFLALALALASGGLAVVAWRRSG